MDRIATARRLRRSQTVAERTLWALVRNRRLGGFRFLRQHPIDRYFADFVCESAKVIVELDGPVHEGCEDYDDRRTETLELFGYLVLRFRNERVLADPGGTTDEILAVLRSGRP
ncbi:endonuclease domain-containing protein [Caulobacter sp. BP25]|uniref:endonuclease domain-containing protein n=1 Tax=Caulobacter sp. BP25 TaxID=2048900 RepID=UPI000C12D7BB|nr:endonuclease domain-containing protein [Caulobacter sp. BP25]PHY17230.1 endonuclease [Caulobacter sp. BP25]